MRAARPRGQRVVGLEHHTSFIRAVRTGKLHGKATSVTRGRTTQVWEASIRDEQEQLVAHGRVHLLASTRRARSVEGRSRAAVTNHPLAEELAAGEGPGRQLGRRCRPRRRPAEMARSFKLTLRPARCDNGQLLGSGEGFQRRLPAERRSSISRALLVREDHRKPRPGVASSAACGMALDPPREIVRGPGVERPVPAAKDVDAPSCARPLHRRTGPNHTPRIGVG